MKVKVQPLLTVQLVTFSAAGYSASSVMAAAKRQRTTWIVL